MSMQNLAEIPIRFAADTHTGRIRKMNQDSYSILDSSDLGGIIQGLFVVADGMGGKAGGEIAGRVTAETVPEVFQDALEEFGSGVDPHNVQDMITQAIAVANVAVHTQARANPELRGMGTTCVTAAIVKSVAVIGNVGDSRAYLHRNGELKQITEDHSLVMEHVRSGELTMAEARDSRYRNLITRAVGIGPDVEPEFVQFPLMPGDRILICSDGLSTMVTDSKIADALDTASDPEECVSRLIQAANDAGGEDNITVVVIEASPDAIVETVQDRKDKRSPAPSMVIVRRNPVNGILVLLLLASAIFATSVSWRGVVWHNEWPFAAPVSKVREVRIAAAVPPEPDFSKFEYDKPILFTTRQVKGGSLGSDLRGRLFAIDAKTSAPIFIEAGDHFQNLPSPDIIPTNDPLPRAWCIDEQGNIYVTDRVKKAVSKYNRSGVRIARLNEGNWERPEAIAVGSNGDIYVVDAGKIKLLRAHPARPHDAPR